MNKNLQIRPERKPEWLKVPLPNSQEFFEIKKELRERGLFTVCEEASCPNIGECWKAKTATLMILGGTCTRACKFCHVDTGNPQGKLNPHEPEQSAEMVKIMDLRYVVITSVDRDDLPDHGAGHFAQVVTEVQRVNPNTRIEVLIPDFDGQAQHMSVLAESRPFVIAQNLETVKRLTSKVRDRRAGYEKTLNVLKFYNETYPHIFTKSSLMVGLGETMEELEEATRDLYDHGVRILTFGQYLRPTLRHLPVERFYTPNEFEHLKAMALKIGMEFVASGPLIRSSYKASEFLDYLESKHDSSFMV